ncbi:MAG: hypothetical protein HY790_01835 [Deltaproteobacteria bacterium]|nr:hypothetical protein [Deltaproteobacteria bacterium]MBI4794579.1 hypothetical protein [Deltaproteobacteria bacterium]
MERVAPLGKYIYFAGRGRYVFNGQVDRDGGVMALTEERQFRVTVND